MASFALSAIAPNSLRGHARAPATRRATIRRGAVAAAGSSVKGQVGFHNVWSIPKSKEAEFDELWKVHEAWMNEAHTVGPAGDDTEKARISEYMISKGEELTNPLDLDSKPTGNLVYVMNELYYSPDGIAKHFELGGQQPFFGDLMGFITDYATALDAGSTEVINSYHDDTMDCAIRKGDTNIHLFLRVPEENMSEVDSFLKEHEVFMRDTHQWMGSGDDLKAPRLTHYTVTKGQEQKDPLDPTKGYTGNYLYCINETYISPEGVGGHMKVAQEEVPELFAKFGSIYERFAFSGSMNTTVIHTMDKGPISNIIKMIKQTVKSLASKN